MDLNHWFQKGIYPARYQHDLDKHREEYVHGYNQFEVPEADKDVVQSTSHVRVIGLAEVWCGHCMVDVRIVQRITENAGMDVSMLPRDEHLELMDQYTTNGNRVIAIFIFIDEAGNEISKWGPMTPELRTKTEHAQTEAT